MNIGAIVTIASGLAAVYVILALITSHFAEAVSSLVGKRGKSLFAGLHDMLGEVTVVGQTSNVADLVYAHPLVAGLGTADRKPSYIPTRSLSLALVSVLHDAASPAAVATVSDAGALAPALLKDLIDNVNALQGSSGVAKSLVLVLQSANNDYNAALKAIDAWFGAQMDRISGAYKRWSFVVQVTIALLIVVALNADTFTIIEQLSKDAVLSTALASAGSATSSAQSVGQQLSDLSNNGLQLGWQAATGTIDAGTVLRKISGLLITWAAALLGAPFWFDLLKQFAPLRMSGAKPADPKLKTADAQAK